MNSYFSVRRKQTLTLVVAMCVALIMALFFYYSPTTVSAEETDVSSSYPSEEIVQKYLESDNLYDEVNDRNLDKTIQDYTTNKFLENGDDTIVQIIPKGFFINPCVVTKMGKEYGFFIYTHSDNGSYNSQVLVFDLNFSNNGNGEYIYKIVPLFAYWYGTTIDSRTGEYSVGPYMGYQSLADELFISNVTFGTSLFNENEYNSQDGTVYNRASDNGPVIYQTKYFDKGYIGSYDNGIEGAVGLIKRIGGSILDFALGDNRYYVMAKKIIKTVKDIESTGKDISLLFDNGKIEGGNADQINENVYKFRNRYDTDEAYIRTSLMCPNEAVAYAAGKNHYVQEVLSIDVDEKTKDYRIVQNISLDIVNLASDGVIEKYSEVDSCRVDVIKTGEKKEIAEGDESLLYTLPEGHISYYFEPAASGEYSFISDNANSAYKLYVSNNKTNEIVSLDLNAKIYLETGKIYYFDLYSNNSDVDIGNVKLLLDRIEFDKTLNKGFSKEASNAIVYEPSETKIVKLKSSNPHIIIKNIYSDEDGNLLDINSSEVSFKSYAGYKYTIEMTNLSNADSTTLTLGSVDYLPSSYDPNHVWTYFRYDVQKNDTYILSLLYEKSKVGLTVFDDKLNNINGSELTGKGFSKFSLSIQNSNYIYIGIKDDSNSSEEVTIKLESWENAYSWIIDYNGDTHTYKSGDIVEVKQGDTIKMRCLINGSVEINNFIVESTAYAYTLNGQELRISEDCIVGGDFPIYPTINTETNAWVTDITSSIKIKPVLNQQYYELEVWNDDNGFGVKWDTTRIYSLKIEALEVDKDGNIIKSLHDETHDSANSITVNRRTERTIRSSVNLLTCENWGYFGMNDIRIIVKEMIVTGKDLGGEERLCMVVPNDLNRSYGYIPKGYITHALFGKRLGYDDDGYFEISCERHLKNINRNRFIDDLDPNVYLVGSYLLVDNITITNSSDIFPLDKGCDYAAFKFYGNGHTISNIANIYADTTIEGDYSKYIGFVKCLKGTIDGLTLDKINISITENNGNVLVCVGSFAGVNYGKISNCEVLYGDINCTSSNMNVGGVVGMNKGTIINTNNRCRVTGRNGNVGGIVGSNFDIVRNCQNAGTVRGNRNVGGIAGVQCNDIDDSPEISGCYTYGAVHYDNKFSDHDCVGGIVGKLSYGSVYNCTSDTDVNIDYCDKSSRTYQPYAGCFIGFLENGSFYGCTLGDDGCINAHGNLVVVTWKEGFIFTTTHTHDQSAYVGGWIGYDAR